MFERELGLMTRHRSAQALGKQIKRPSFVDSDVCFRSIRIPGLLRVQRALLLVIYVYRVATRKHDSKLHYDGSL